MRFSLNPEARTIGTGKSPIPIYAYVDGQKTETQQTNDQGVPLWRVPVGVVDEGVDELAVKIAARSIEDVTIPPLTEITLVGLELGLWKGNITARAEGIEAA